MKKTFLVIAGIIGLAVLGSISDSGTNYNRVTSGPTYYETSTTTVHEAEKASDNSFVEGGFKPVAPEPEAVAPVKTVPQVTTTPQLSNDNYYKNVDGNTVHSPTYSNTVPVGAMGRCRDGTYSFSQNRRGTCSHHGGVATWL